MARLNKTCKHCGKPFLAERSSSEFCSDKCRKAYKRSLNKPKRLTPKQKIEGSTFFNRLVNEAVRAGTVRIFPSNQNAFNQLYELHAKAAILNFSLPKGQGVDISHYCPSVKRGAYEPSNLGIWPSQVNKSHGSSDMPFGKQIKSYTEYGDPKYKCSTRAEARKLILQHFGQYIANIHRDGKKISLPLSPFTKKVKELMKRENIPFEKFLAMSQREILALFHKHGLDKEKLRVVMSKEKLAKECSLRDIPFDDTRDEDGKLTIKAEELLSILTANNVTKEDLQNFHMQDILRQLFRDEALRQIKLYPAKTELLKEFLYSCDAFEKLFEDVPAWVKFGSYAITGKASVAIDKLKKACNRQSFNYEQLTSTTNYQPIETDSALILDDNTHIFEYTTLRQESELTSDQLYTWYAKECQMRGERPQRVTDTQLRELFKKAA